MSPFDAIHPRISDGTFTTVARSEATGTVLVPPPATTSTTTITDDDVDWFSHGHCVDLAVALHERTGWPFAVVADGNDVEGVTPWVHIGVQRPDGAIVDVNGASDPDEWTEEWGSFAAECNDDFTETGLVVEADPALLGFDALEVEVRQGADLGRSVRVAIAVLARLGS